MGMRSKSNLEFNKFLDLQGLDEKPEYHFVCVDNINMKYRSMGLRTPYILDMGWQEGYRSEQMMESMHKMAILFLSLLISHEIRTVNSNGETGKITNYPKTFWSSLILLLGSTQFEENVIISTVWYVNITICKYYYIY